MPKKTFEAAEDNKNTKKKRPKEVKIEIGKDANGKPIRKSFYGPTKKRARAKGEEYIEGLKGGKSLADPDVLFKAWAETWLETYVTEAGGRKESTKKWTYEGTIKNHLIPHFGDSRVAEIKAVDIQNFFNKNKDKSESQLHKCDFILRAIFEQAVENDIISKSPHKRINSSSERISVPKKSYTKRQQKTHLEFCRTHEYGLLAALPLLTSVSRSEACGLMLSDFDPKEMTVHIQRGLSSADGLGTPKTKHRKRYVPYTHELVDLMAGISGLYVLTLNGKPMTPDNLQYRYEKFQSDLLAAHPKMPRLTYHELRHTYATLLNESGVPDNTIALLMGHGKDSKITNEIYIHQNMEHIKKVMGISAAPEKKRKNKTVVNSRT